MESQVVSFSCIIVIDSCGWHQCMSHLISLTLVLPSFVSFFKCQSQHSQQVGEVLTVFQGTSAKIYVRSTCSILFISYNHDKHVIRCRCCRRSLWPTSSCTFTALSQDMIAGFLPFGSVDSWKTTCEAINGYHWVIEWECLRNLAWRFSESFMFSIIWFEYVWIN